jgi:uncharacterized protein (DUF1501 family)
LIDRQSNSSTGAGHVEAHRSLPAWGSTERCERLRIRDVATVNLYNAPMPCTRRDLVRLGLAGLASLGLGTCRGPTPDAERRRVNRPRYIVTILLTGGMDAIWTTDPRERAEIEPGIDLPYPSSAIIEAGALKLGPHLAAFVPVAQRLTVINGVQVATASHGWGWMQFDRMRTGVDERMPIIGSLLAETRDGQPLEVMQLPLDEATFRRMERLNPVDQLAMAAALDRQRRRLSAEQARGPAGHSLSSAAALLERMATASRFVLEPWIDAPTPSSANLQLALQRTLWAIENDLVACCQLSIDRYVQPWDSHWDNSQMQSAVSGRSFPLIARFLGRLGEARNAYGLLADQTLVVIGSELGRFPRLNSALGKDHWPEVPLLFWGAGVVHQQTFGQTGSHLQAVPVSLRTGRGVPTGGELLTLDDVGTTLLYLAGLDPEPRGYLGRRLDFLVAA